MADAYTSSYDDQRSGYRIPDYSRQPDISIGPVEQYEPNSPLASFLPLLGGSGFAGQANSLLRGSIMQNAQALYGNHALQRYIGQPAPTQQQYAPGADMPVHAFGTTSADAMPVQQSTPTAPSAEMITAQGGPQMLPGGMWLTPGERSVEGWGRPANGNGFFGYYDSTPYDLSIPGLPDVTLNDFDLAGGLDLMGTTLFGGSVSGGTWENENDATRVGMKANLGVLPSGKGMFGTEESLLSVGGEASVGEDGLTIGGGLTVAGTSATVNDNFSRESNIDQSLRFGLSEGPSLGGRLHWGDKDDDGYREYGFGFDLGPASFDIKTEDPLRYLTHGANPLYWLLPDEVNPWTQNLPEGNMTESAMESLSSADDWLYGTLKGGVDAAGDWWYGEQGLDPLPPPPMPTGGSPEGLFPAF